jgi:hypothetical protein
MTETELLKRVTAPVKAELTSTSMPYTVPNTYTPYALNVINTHASTALTLTLTLDSGTLVLTIPASTSWADFVPGFKSIAASGTTSYIVQVKGQ